MSSEARPLLFSPLRIGPLNAPNRIVCGAHFTMFIEPATTVGEPGFYGARYGRYLGERAAGGAGVIIAGQAQVHPTTAYQMRNNAIAWDEAAIPHFEQVTAPIHEHGALAFLQLAHNGGVNDGTWSKLPAWAPSAVANYIEPPKPLERDEIRELVEYFARSAANAAAGGFDGIEMHGAHGYLIHEFLSPKSNHRTDEYGGSLENRMRFGVEVLEAVRAAVGDGVAVGLRLVGDEEQRDGSGLTADDAAEIAARLGGRRPRRLPERQRRRLGHRHGAPAVRAAPARRVRRAHGEEGAARHAGVRGAPHPDARRGRGDPRARRRRRGHARAGADRRPGVGSEGARRPPTTRSAAAPAATRAATAT